MEDVHRCRLDESEDFEKFAYFGSRLSTITGAEFAQNSNFTLCRPALNLNNMQHINPFNVFSFVCSYLYGMRT